MSTPHTLVIFDVDGTLVYSIDKRDSRCFADTYEKLYGRPFPSIDWRRYPHVNDTTIFKSVIAEHFDRSIFPNEIEFFLTHYSTRLIEQREATPHYFLEIPGATATVNRLIDHPDYTVAIATGGWQRPAEIKLAHIGIDTSDIIIYGADGKTTREDIIEAVLNDAHESGQNFSKIVYIGDAIWDVQTTRKMRMDFLGIGFRDQQNILKQAGAIHVIPDFSDFELFINCLSIAEPPLQIA